MRNALFELEQEGFISIEELIKAYSKKQEVTPEDIAKADREQGVRTAETSKIRQFIDKLLHRTRGNNEQEK